MCIRDSVATSRIMEHEMAYYGGTNEVGRIGAEIAYTVATERLGLKNVFMDEPNRGGADLYTPGHKEVIEARMLQRTMGQSGPALNDYITEQLNELVGRLNGDFGRFREQGMNPTVGYAMLTYIVDENTIKTIILEVVPR